MSAYEKERDVAIGAARAAGVVVMESYACLPESDVGEKGENDMVTAVDHRAQAIVVGAIRDAFPGDFIIAEETLSETINAGLDPEGSRRWYIDPLDGTTNYIHAFPMFAVNIALEVDRVMTLGVTFAPRDEEMFHAVRGAGAWLNDERIRVSNVSARNRMLLGTGFPFRARRYLDIYLRSFAHFFRNVRGIRRAGSAALDFAYVASGRLDGFWEMTLSPWDMAAGIVLIEEAGGRVSDFFGGDSFLETGHVVATNAQFQDWMIGELGKIFSPGENYTIRS